MIAPSVFAKSAKTEPLPHFFPPGMITTTVPSEQWTHYIDYLRATSVCQNPGQGAWPITFPGNMQVVREIEGKKVTFHFDPWHREADGKIYYTDFCGRRLVTEREWKVASEFLIKHYIRGVHEAYMFHKDVETAIIEDKARAEGKTPEAVRKELAAPVSELAKLDPPVTLRELAQIPEGPFAERDFIQTEVHFTHAPVLGAVYLNTETVFLTLQAAMMDYLIGRPSVVIHELTHGNEKLQDWIYGDVFDMEYLASIPEMLLPEDKMSLFFHGYFEAAREMIHVISGFDFAQARKEIILFNTDGVGLRIDAQKMNTYVAMLDEIKKKLSKHYREVVLPEIYRNRLYWASVNKRLGDSRACFQILLMKDFDPTILGGHRATMEWYEQHKDEIMAMALEALTSTEGAVRPENDASSRTKGRNLAVDLERLKLLSGMNEDELLALVRKHRLNPRDLAQMPPDEALQIILPILRSEREGRKGKEILK